MDTLVSKLGAQGWSSLLLQGNHQRRFGKDEMYEFYTHGVAIGDMISTSVHGKLINLYPTNLRRILSVPSRGWGHYVKESWPSLDNLPSALDICRKFSGNSLLPSHRRVLKNEMSSPYQLYFDMVHKMILPRQERRTVAIFLDLTLMELLDSEIPIDLPQLIIKHMQKVLIKDKNGHALPYQFWLAPVFDDFLNHAILPASIRRADNPMQKLQNALEAKQGEMEVAQAALEAAKAIHKDETRALKAQITSLTTTLEKERTENAAIIRSLTFFIPSTSSK
ncbi:hypothetical protein P3L10_019886 [Capsicum annuum]